MSIERALGSGTGGNPVMDGFLLAEEGLFELILKRLKKEPLDSFADMALVQFSELRTRQIWFAIAVFAAAKNPLRLD